MVLFIPCFSQIDSLESVLGKAEGKEKLIILDALAQATVKSQDALLWADKLKAAATNQGDAHYMALSHH